ncbi:MAG: hypothetical protein IT337_10015 [Thermomicrobiales bacterium]|nr:hypothetical protein [Thermomicrobiales bacterium]
MTTNANFGDSSALVPHSGSSPEELARKAIHVHRLTDPLGAMGQRRTASRRATERAARRALAVAAGAGFLAAFGLVSLAGGQPQALDPAPPVSLPAPVVASGEVISEIPVTLPDGPVILRVVATGDAPVLAAAPAQQPAPRPRLRTRQS